MNNLIPETMLNANFVNKKKKKKRNENFNPVVVKVK